MANINDFKKKLSLLREKMKALKDAVTPETMTEKDVETFDELKKEIENLKSMIAALTDAEEEEKAMDEEADEEEKDLAHPDKVEDEDDISEINNKGTKMYKPAVIRNMNAKTPTQAAQAFMIASAVKNLYGSTSAARDYIAKGFGESYDVVNKTITATASPNLIPQDFVPNFLEALWSKAVVRSSGPTVIKTANGNAIAPALGATSSAYWVNEAVAPTESEASFQNVRFGAHKLGAVSAVSNDWLRRSDLALQAANRITETMARDMVLKEDLAFLLGTGASGAQPLGIKNTPNIGTYSSNLSTVSSTALVNAVQSVLTAAEVQLAQNNVDLGDAVWYMPYQVKGFLRSIVNALGVAPYAAELSEDKLLGHPVFISNQIPTNLGTNADSTYLFLVNPKHLWIADTLNVTFATSLDATVNISGATVSARAQDLTIFTAFHETDLQIPYPQAVSVGTLAGWSLGALNSGIEASYAANINAGNATVSS